MGISYDQAVSALYRAPLESFVTERKRIAAELKADGDKPGAAQLAKLARPSTSAWAVNQLWWQARPAFDELFETAAELRRGKVAASAAHRKVLAKLAARAQQLLSEAGHSANDATVRRVTMTLSALAAAGSFEPDTPGALSKDRDPPGFEAFGIVSSSDGAVEDAHAAAKSHRETETAEHKGEGGSAATERKRDEAAERKHRAEAAERKRDAEAAERKHRAEAEAERKRAAEAAREAEAERKARRKELEHGLRDAKAVLADREREHQRIEKELAKARHELERALADVEAAEAELAKE